MQGDWLLEYKCHDEIESEYLSNGLKIVQHPLKATHIHNANMEAVEFWNKLVKGKPNPVKGKVSRNDCYNNWGHSDPIIVSRNDKNLRIELIFV